MDVREEPFLLHPSSRDFLDGDRRGIQQRFQFRRDVFDYGAIALMLAGGLLLVVNVLQVMRAVSSDDRGAAASALVLGGLLVAAGLYYVISRHRTAAARARMIREGTILPGTIIACDGRQETTTEAALGEVTRAYRVTVEYRFMAPSGLEISNQDESDRPDLRKAELPAADAAVRVLYLDDRTYALL